MDFGVENESFSLILAQSGCDHVDRELDSEIAKALGYKVVEYVPGKFAAVKDMNESFLKNPLPYYSQDGNAVLELDKEIKSRGWLLILRAFADRKVKASYWQHGKDECNPCVPGSGVAAIAETIPKAIALAARHALRVSVNLEGNCK